VKNLDRIIDHLKDLDHDFFGEVVIRVRDGQAVLITEERSYKIEPETNINSKGAAGEGRTSPQQERQFHAQAQDRPDSYRDRRQP